METDGATRQVGVFGSPITHSASPAMHNAAFAALGMNWRYEPVHVEPPDLRAELRRVRDLGWVGVNLTIPHKILALKMMDKVNQEARQLGAINTVLFAEGQMLGFNTDGYGFTQAIQEDFGLSLEGKRVLVLGAGGAARAIAVQCALERTATIFVSNRTAARITPIAQIIKRLDRKFEPVDFNPAAIARLADHLDLIVNATSVGLRPGDTLGLSADCFRPTQAVYDTIYRPTTTELLRIAANAGARVANGLSMLLHQGARAFEIWTNRPAPVAVMRQALRAAVAGESA